MEKSTLSDVVDTSMEDLKVLASNIQLLSKTFVEQVGEMIEEFNRYNIPTPKEYSNLRVGDYFDNDANFIVNADRAATFRKQTDAARERFEIMEKYHSKIWKTHSAIEKDLTNLYQRYTYSYLHTLEAYAKSRVFMQKDDERDFRKRQLFYNNMPIIDCNKSELLPSGICDIFRKFKILDSEYERLYVSKGEQKPTITTYRQQILFPEKHGYFRYNIFGGKRKNKTNRKTRKTNRK